MDEDNSPERKQFNKRITPILHTIQGIYIIFDIITIFILDPDENKYQCNRRYLIWRWLYFIITLVIINIFWLFIKVIYVDYNSTYKNFNYIVALIGLLYTILEYRLGRCNIAISEVNITITLVLYLFGLLFMILIDLYYYKKYKRYQQVIGILTNNRNNINNKRYRNNIDMAIV